MNPDRVQRQSDGESSASLLQEKQGTKRGESDPTLRDRIAIDEAKTTCGCFFYFQGKIRSSIAFTRQNKKSICGKKD
jgi:hypothetical protein